MIKTEVSPDIFNFSAKEKIHINKQLKKHGWISSEFLYDLLHKEFVAFESFGEQFNRQFTSFAGREFKHAYDQCHEAACDVAQLKAAAKQYYFETKGFVDPKNNEYVLVGLLTGEDDVVQLAQDEVVYSNCLKGKYYQRNGLDALRKKTLAAYLSSHDLKGAQVCFSQNKSPKTSLQSIGFTWYSKEEIPRRLAIYGIHKKNGLFKEELLTIYHPETKEQLAEINGSFFSVLALQLTQVYDDYKVVLLEGGQSNRLLLRALSPVFLRDQNVVSKADRVTDVLLKLADKVSHQKPYGPGIQKLSGDEGCTSNAILNYMSDQATLHCGNFAYIFMNALKAYASRGFKLKAFDGRIHVVVQVDTPHNSVVVDPTTGMLYPCDLSALIVGSCSYEKVQFLTPTHPALLVYSGKGFFYGAEIIETYQDVDAFTQGYC